MDKAPSTLQEAVIHYSNPDNCNAFVIKLRWADGKVRCPQCGSEDVAWLPNARLFKCYEKHGQQKFSLKVGTIFEDSPLGLNKWLPVMWMLVNCKNGISSYEIHRDIGVTQKTAWFMLQRARLAMQDDVTGGKLGGEVEVDETFIGGKARNMHKSKRAEKIHGRGPEGKAIVAAVLERGGKVRAKVMDTRKKKALQALVRENVALGSSIYSDALKSYEGLDKDFEHQVIDHAEAYVDGQVHTTGIENFWSLLKRSLKGTYVSGDEENRRETSHLRGAYRQGGTAGSANDLSGRAGGSGRLSLSLRPTFVRVLISLGTVLGYSPLNFRMRHR